MIYFNELYKFITSQPLISTDLPILIDGKCVTEMNIAYNNGQYVIELKTE